MAVIEEVSPLERKIIRQIEYYFGDFNLYKDKFLKETMKEDDGWISMEILLKFKRLADLTTDPTVILKALEKSDSGLMEVDKEGDGKVRRSPSQPLPEMNDESKKVIEAKTAYAKGFDPKGTTMNELLEYYAEHEPTVVNIQMRNYACKIDKVKKFKGSIFMTFRNEEECKKFVEAESKKYKDVELVRKFQKDYLAEKAKEYEEKKNKKKGGKKQEKEDGNDNKEEEAQYSLPKGAVIKLTGLGGEITREDIKDMLKADFEVDIDKDSGDIAFITYQKGEEEAKVRFKAENYGVELMKKLEKAEKIQVKETEVKASLLEGEEETTYLAEALKELKERMHRNKNKNHKRKHGGRGGGPGGKRSKRN
eukprot:TRINITY_DN2048_c0_g1_i1.p1 TRINITY_DN2048_c0_g1~~TRINITY_DN2048_c0_g1_i1.p1  ORF type:complete len:365 (+),score=133.50 TRINITY_DN2048_c0_g1_i1:51-1145(+)